MALKFAFVTCVQLGLACMEEIYQAGGKLDLVLTLNDEQAPNKSGRVYVDVFCGQQGIDVLKVRSINDEELPMAWPILASLAKAIPWVALVQQAPAILEAANKLRAKNKPAESLNSAGQSSESQFAAICSRLEALEAQDRETAEVVQQLALQNQDVVCRINNPFCPNMLNATTTFLPKKIET